MMVDGRKIAEEIITELGTSLRGMKLGMVVGAEDAATSSFIKIKSRVAGRLGVEVVRGDLEELVQTCDGVIIQLPIQNSDALLAALPPEKDVDGIGTMGEPLVLPPVVGAIKEILEREHTVLVGKTVAVAGEGKLVGLPAAAWFKTQGAHVEHVTLPATLSHDVVVLGVGSPGLLKPEMLKQGAVVLDAGTSEAAGKLMGDADPRCADVASVFTPVPGGIGPIAVAMIFKNLFELVKIQK